MSNDLYFSFLQLSNFQDQVYSLILNKILMVLQVFFGKILVCAQCPSCPLPFRPSEMPFPQNDLPFNALHQNALSEMPFQICPSSKCPFGNANSNMPFQKCPFKNALSHFALSQFALSQFALYQIAVYHECNIFIYFRL